jgi:hypothetical protein
MSSLCHHYVIIMSSLCHHYVTRSSSTAAESMRADTSQA